MESDPSQVAEGKRAPATGWPEDGEAYTQRNNPEKLACYNSVKITMKQKQQLPALMRKDEKLKISTKAHNSCLRVQVQD